MQARGGGGGGHLKVSHHENLSAVHMSGKWKFWGGRTMFCHRWLQKLYLYIFKCIQGFAQVARYILSFKTTCLAISTSIESFIQPAQLAP